MNNKIIKPKKVEDISFKECVRNKEAKNITEHHKIEEFVSVKLLKKYFKVILK